MTLSGYRFGIRTFTLLGLSAFLAFFFGMDPGSLRAGGLVLFFLSFWVTAAGIFSLLLLSLYERVLGEKGTAHNIGGVLRQGSFLGGFCLATLLLLYFSLLAWWSTALAFTFFVLLEFTIRKLFQ